MDLHYQLTRHAWHLKHLCIIWQSKTRMIPCNKSADWGPSEAELHEMRMSEYHGSWNNAQDSEELMDIDENQKDGSDDEEEDDDDVVDGELLDAMDAVALTEEYQIQYRYSDF